MLAAALGKSCRPLCNSCSRAVSDIDTRLGILTAIREASVVSKVLAFSNLEAKERSKDRGRSVTPTRHKLPAVETDLGRSAVINAGRHTTANGAEPFMGKHLPLETLFYLATMGGAEVCALQDRIGNFEVGKEFDALLIRTGQKEANYRGPNPFDEQPNPALFIEQTDPLEALFEKFLFAGDDRNVGLESCESRSVC